MSKTLRIKLASVASKLINSGDDFPDVTKCSSTCSTLCKDSGAAYTITGGAEYVRRLFFSAK